MFSAMPAGGDHVGRDEVVAGEAVAAREVAEAAAQGQAGDTGGGDDAAGRGRAEGVGGVIEVAPGAAGFGARGLGARIDADAFHRREVEDQAVVARAEAGGSVAAAADGDVELGIPGEVHRADDVGDPGGADDQRGAPIDASVIDLARRFVGVVTG
ncbi:MAG TPA: hypothetical protein VGF05_17125 [Bryobacteraceae bacterium]